MEDPEEAAFPTLDALDRQILHALNRDGRAPLSRIAEVLGRAEQTVARRYRRLREAGVVRVIVMRDTDRMAQSWFVRMQIKPSAVSGFAELIARRQDISWVSVTPGGEVLCSMRPRSREVRDSVLLERLPRTSQITGLTTAMILQPFVSWTSEWSAFDDPLTAEQEAALTPAGVDRRRRAPSLGPLASPTTAPGPHDEQLLDLLREDGRATYAELAAQTGLTPAQAGRRVEALLGSGAAYLDVDMAYELLGFPVIAVLWVTVLPGRLDPVGRAVAEHEETSFVAAVTGNANLFVSLTCRSTDQLYRYVTGTLGAIDGIQHVEVVPILRRVKQAGTLMEGRRLPNPTATTQAGT